MRNKPQINEQSKILIKKKGMNFDERVKNSQLKKEQNLLTLKEKFRNFEEENNLIFHPKINNKSCLNIKDAWL